MADWIDHLTLEEAQAVLNAPIKTRYMARDDRGSKAMRYVAPSAGQLARIKEKASGQLP